jgi:hypothetical protein
VLEVDRLADLLGQPRRRPAPGPVADCFVPRFQVVQTVEQQQRQRRGDQQVVEIAGDTVFDPRPLLL